jgi:hypothetical protein
MPYLAATCSLSQKPASRRATRITARRHLQCVVICEAVLAILPADVGRDRICRSAQDPRRLAMLVLQTTEQRIVCHKTQSASETFRSTMEACCGASSYAQRCMAATWRNVKLKKDRAIKSVRKPIANLPAFNLYICKVAMLVRGDLDLFKFGRGGVVCPDAWFRKAGACPSQ